MNYSLSKTFVKKNCDDYIGVVYKVNIIDKNKNKFEIDSTENLYFLKSSKQETAKSTKNLELDYNYRILPILHQSVPDNIQRDICVIYGASGSGKSKLSNDITELYKNLNPKNKIYFVSNNNVSMDTSINHEFYIFITVDELLERYDEENIEDFKTNNNFDNSLIVFDDITFENKKKKHQFFSFLNIILMFKRKNNISAIYTTHHISDYQYTRTLLNEMTIYITFSCDLKNRSNRVFTDYLKLNKSEIDKITSSSSRWNCINTRAKTIITESEVYSVK